MRFVFAGSVIFVSEPVCFNSAYSIRQSYSAVSSSVNIRDYNGLSDAWASREGRDVGCQRVYFNSTRMRLIFAGSAIFVNEAILNLPIVSGDHSQQFRALLMCMTVVHDQMRRSVEGGGVGCQWVYFNSTRVCFSFAGSAIFISESVAVSFLPIR